jgi:copper chaperone
MVKMKITGMRCGHCKAAVEKALGGVAGVGAVRVSLEAGTAEVDGIPDVAALIAAVKEEGYGAELA